MTRIERPAILLSILALAALTSACAPTEVDVDLSAAALGLELDPSASEELAAIEVTLDIEAGPEAYAMVSLVRAALYEPGATMIGGLPLSTLELGLPETFEPRFEPDDRRPVTLDNLGTSNGDLAELEAYCGSSLDLLVEIDFDAVDGQEPGVDGMTLVIEVPLACS